MVRWPRVSQLTFGQVLKVSQLTLGSHAPTVGMKQSPDLGSAYVLAPQSPGLPQTEEMFTGVSWLILKLREVSSLSVGTIYSFHKRSSDQTYVNKHKQT